LPIEQRFTEAAIEIGRYPIWKPAIPQPAAAGLEIAGIDRAPTEFDTRRVVR
jgi:hypothetical protein